MRQAVLCCASEVVMIGWTRLVLATAWLMSAPLGCARATAKPSTPDSVRSPPLDYGDGPRSANDGEIMGAHGVSTQDWLLGSATTDHAAPGWSLRDGRLHFEREHVQAGSRAAPACPPGSAPLAPDEEENYAVLQRALLDAVRDPALPALASVIELRDERSSFLSCDTR
jgi:hypothetical protein